MADDEAMLMESTPTPITKKMEIIEAHEKLGHPDKKTTRLTLESFEWNAIGEMEPCDGCLKHKAKAKDVSHKPSKTQATKPGGRLFMDTTGPYEISAGGTKYDIHVVDQNTDMGWVAHVAQRTAVPKMFDGHREMLKGKGISVEHLRCDNAGEHQTKLQKVCEENGIAMEYTPPNTPQMNGVAERRIASTNRSTFTMLHGGQFNERF
jgi:hypothetical protein